MNAARKKKHVICTNASILYINSIKTKHYMNKLVNDFDSDNCCFKFTIKNNFKLRF